MGTVSVLRKIPPHNLEAEETILGGILLDNTALDRVMEIINESDFYYLSNQKIYRAILDLNERGQAVNVISVIDLIKSRGESEIVGGATYIAELFEKAISAAFIVDFAKIVKDKSSLRAMVRVSGEIADRCYTEEDVDHFIDEAEHMVFSVAGKRNRSSFLHIGESAASIAAEIEKAVQTKNTVTGISTGFIDVDRMTCGLQPSDLIVIASRPSVGKTSFATNIAYYVAHDSHIPVAFFSLEMSRNQLVSRIVSSAARVDHMCVKTGHLNDSEFARLSMSLGKLAYIPIFVDDNAAQNVLEVRSKARKMKREKNISLIVIDYLQLMTGAKKTENRVQEITEISRQLKILAKELNVPVVALSQLNRQLEYRSDKRPLVSDLRESGGIEQDADVIMLLYRDEVYNSDPTTAGIAEVNIGKNRNGPTGVVKLAFHKEYTRFDNYIPD